MHTVCFQLYDIPEKQNQRDSTKISVSQELGVAGWGLNKWSPEDF